MTEQSELSRKFITEAKALIDTGTVKNYSVLGEAINLNKSSMSIVINGRINIPHNAYRIFVQKFKPATMNEETTEVITAKKLFYENKVPYPLRLKPSIITLVEEEAIELNQGSAASMIDRILFEYFRNKGKIN